METALERRNCCSDCFIISLQLLLHQSLTLALPCWHGDGQSPLGITQASSSPSSFFSSSSSSAGLWWWQDCHTSESMSVCLCVYKNVDKCVYYCVCVSLHVYWYGGIDVCNCMCAVWLYSVCVCVCAHWCVKSVHMQRRVDKCAYICASVC